jgi:hypothetical protein
LPALEVLGVYKTQILGAWRQQEQPKKLNLSISVLDDIVNFFRQKRIFCVFNNRVSVRVKKYRQ